MSLQSQNHHIRPFARASAQPQYAPDITLSPIHLELHLNFDILNKKAMATAIWTIICKNPASQELILDGVDLNIQSISSADQPLKWWQNHGKIHIRWNNRFENAEVRKVEIQYSVQNPVAGLYFGGPTELQPDRGHYVVSDHETTRARYWLPCIDHSNIRTPLDIYITHDSKHEALSSGALLSCTPQENGQSISHWHLDNPCAIYLLCVAVGEFTRFDDGEFEGAPIAAFAPNTCTVDTLSAVWSHQRHHGHDHQTVGTYAVAQSTSSSHLGLAEPWKTYPSWWDDAPLEEPHTRILANGWIKSISTKWPIPGLAI